MHNSYWDKIAQDYHNVSSLLTTHREKYDLIAKDIIENNVKSLLDLGCGTGLFIKLLFEKGYKGVVVGVDSSEGMLNIAKKENLNNDKVSFSKVNLNLELPYLESSFDGVCLINVLFNLNNIDKIAAELSRIIIPGGILIIVEPNNDKGIRNIIKENKSLLKNKKAFQTFLRNIFSFIRLSQAQQELDHLIKKGKERYFTVDEISETLKKVKFKVIKTKTIQAGTNNLIIAKKEK